MNSSAIGTALFVNGNVGAGFSRLGREAASRPNLRLRRTRRLKPAPTFGARDDDKVIHKMRIVSFLPSATEMVCALGLADHLVGISYECDYPPEVRSRPVVVRSALPVESMTQPEIDHAVSERLRSGQSLYEVDEDLLRQ